MMRRLQRILTVCAMVCIAIVSAASTTQNRFTQLVFSFPNHRDFQQTYNAQENSLNLEFLNTTPEELSALDYYDESLIKRIVIKDLRPRGTEVKVMLRDRSVRAAISEQEEPYRVMVDLFDKDFEQARDPVTGIPLVSTPQINTPVYTGEIALEDTPAPSTPRNEPTRKLLQAAPPLVTSPLEMRSAIDQIEPGIGKKWRDYPIYVYRLQTATYLSGKDIADSKQIDKAMSSTQAMADFAGRLFDFGHENRALLAYQQVLHKDPKIFDDSALHLWKFAESHMGQGNLTLADGYFQAVIEKHPQSELSEFAKLRRLDIEAIAATQAQNTEPFLGIAKRLDQVNSRNSTELKAQIKIREAYWTGLGTSKNKALLSLPSYIPDVSPTLQNELRDLGKSSEGQRTGFLAYTIVLSNLLNSDKAWNAETSTYSSEYFQRFSGTATEPFRGQLKDKFAERFDANIRKKLDEKKFIPIIEDYDSLSKPLQDIVDQIPTVAWAIAESHRKLGNTDRSIRFYDLAAKHTENKSDRFRANFWLAVTAADARQQLKSSSQNPSRVALLGDLSRAADRNMEQSWKDLDDKARNEVSSTMQQAFEKTLESDIALKTPAVAILSMYTQKLATKVDTGSEANPADANSSPFGQSVQTLSKLAKRFVELGMPKERQEALDLLKKIKPSSFKNDAEAKKIWAKELLGLAEEYRQQDNLLEAGRLYAFTGGNADDYANRAEALYKGGLLLYRAGRREEAITALKSCSEDGNNKYYANLCLERLDKLNNQ